MSRFNHVTWTKEQSPINVELKVSTQRLEALDEPDLTGADIRNICELAYQLDVSLEEARKFVVPLKTQSPVAIAEARAIAHDRFISASSGGVYQAPGKRMKTNRKPARLVSQTD